MSEKLTHFYRALLNLGRSLAVCKEPKSLLEVVAQTLSPMVQFDLLALLLYDGTPESLSVHAITGEGRHLDLSSRRFEISETPVGFSWDHQETVVVCRTEEEARWPEFMDKMRSIGIRSLIVLPLAAGDQRMGVLGLGHRAAYARDESELEFLKRIAGELALTMNEYLTRKQLAFERDRLQVLHEITNALISKLAPDELFSAISSQLHRIIPHTSASIALYDRKANELLLHFLQVRGEYEEIDIPKRRPLAGTPMESVISTGRPLVLNENDLAGLSGEMSEILAGRGIKALCCLPLITPNGILGMLNLTGTETDAFGPEDMQLLGQVAGQIAVAIENSLIYQEVTKLKENLATEKLYLEEEIQLDRNPTEMVGQSLALQAVVKGIQIVAPTDATVLITGETGTGKELVARAIHEMSPRKQQSFVKLSCAAIPSGLLESELFGHEKGAYTGATNTKIGRFELAHRGTLFLDEIGDIPLELQSKLLRAIQEQEFERIGSNHTTRVDVRIIAATNRDLKRLVEENLFRSDLFYRLNVFPVNVPPLRDRPEDIPLLVRHFTQKFAKRMARHIEVIPSKVIAALSRYHWPGNIRELQNLIERSVILSEGKLLQVPLAEIINPHSDHVPAVYKSVDSAERDRIIHALKETVGIVGGSNGAAARLGMKRTTLQSRMKKLKISREYT
jgi:formate hydrogenlyase transcriptional activator